MRLRLSVASVDVVSDEEKTCETEKKDSEKRDSMSTD